MQVLPNLPKSIGRICFEKKRGDAGSLQFPANDTAVLFLGPDPYAILSGGAVYFREDAIGPKLRAVHSWQPHLAYIRCAPYQFDFVLGQVLTSAGIVLTAREIENG